MALDLARAFRAAGHAVHLADSLPSAAAALSRPRLPIHRLPPPRQRFAAFRAAMLRLVEGLQPRLVVPTCEEVFYLAAAAQADGWADRLFAPPLALLRRLHSKAEFPALARSAGLAVPRTRRLTDPGELAGLDLGATVLKPEFSRFATHAHVRPTDISRIVPTPQRPWVAQDFIAGEELCLWSAVHAGRVTAAALYRPRWRLGRSAAYAFEAVDDTAALAIAHRVAEATGMSGHLSFDLIVTPEGVPVPIECNPRAVSGLHLFDAAPGLAQALLGSEIAAPPAGRLRYAAPAMLLLGPATGRWRALLGDWRRGADAIGRPGDRLPAWGSVLDAARFALAVAGARSGSTADIEWNGEPIL